MNPDTAPPPTQPNEVLRGETRLEDIWGKFIQVTAVPTWTPRTLRESIAFDTSAAKIYYYDFTNNAWKTASSPTDAYIRALLSATKQITYNNSTGVISFARRVTATTQSATPTINTDNTDVASITGLAQAITSMTTNLSGSPAAGDSLIIEITDDGTARAITWGASFESSGQVILPTTTVISTKLTVGFLWNSASSKWRCVGVA